MKKLLFFLFLSFFFSLSVSSQYVYFNYGNRRHYQRPCRIYRPPVVVYNYNYRVPRIPRPPIVCNPIDNWINNMSRDGSLVSKNTKIDKYFLYGNIYYLVYGNNRDEYDSNPILLEDIGGSLINIRNINYSDDNVRIVYNDGSSGYIHFFSSASLSGTIWQKF